PALTDKPGNNPNVPQGAPTDKPLSQLMPIEPPAQVSALMRKEPAPGDPSVGRYVVRNDDWGWVDSANRFYNGLQDSGWGGWLSFPQYYWAYPFETGSSKDYYANSVNVAELEIHGDLAG